MNPVATRRKLQHQHRREEGLTLVELLVVLGIIALLAALVAPQVIRYLGDARSSTARVQIKNVESALELYYLDTGTYPTKEQGLQALVEAPAGLKTWNGPYLKKDAGITDPWGQMFQYKSPGDHGAYDLYSYGRDKAQGGEGEDTDIVSW